MLGQKAEGLSILLLRKRLLERNCQVERKSTMSMEQEAITRKIILLSVLLENITSYCIQGQSHLTPLVMQIKGVVPTAGNMMMLRTFIYGNE